MDKLREELIAYIEGELAPEARSRVEREIENSPEVHAELEWLRAAYADLEAIEHKARIHAGSIDIVDGVMCAVKKATAPVEVVSFEKARSAKRALWPALAAAAAVMAAIGYLVFSGPDAPATNGTTNGTTGPQLAAPPKSNVPELPTSLANSRDALEKKRKELGPDADEIAKPLVLTQGPNLQLPGGVDEVIAARRDATTKGASVDKLLEWARLDREFARKLVDAPDADPDVLVAASESLAGEERRRVLLTAVGKLEDDPNSRMQLARAYVDEPAADPRTAEEHQAQALTQLSDVKSIDPENALPYYFEAKVQLDEGDTEAALLSLQSASGLSEASAYSLKSALAQAEALEASGMEADVARMVAALTAGVDENNFLCQLAADLLEYAQGFLSANDTATAEAIYNGVEQLGRQVEAGADLSQEQLAGVDIQRHALEGLGQLYTTVESADGVASVTEATNALTVDVIELAEFLTALDELFLKPMTTEFWNLLSGIVLVSGDIFLFENPEIASATAPAATP
ncbi:MAG: hypothetical protein HUU46_24660 [Candidatus Hydrogenedentes bacterium]|nr:hypothetical protein [Candidatus Hydrogenedentota bacterium]